MCTKFPIWTVLFYFTVVMALAGSNVACGYYSNQWLIEATASVESKAI